MLRNSILKLCYKFSIRSSLPHPLSLYAAGKRGNQAIPEMPRQLRKIMSFCLFNFIQSKLWETAVQTIFEVFKVEETNASKMYHTLEIGKVSKLTSFVPQQLSNF